MVSRARWNIRRKARDMAVYINGHDFVGPGEEGLHDHDFVELLYARGGCGRHRINGQELLFCGGEVILIHPQDRHQMWLEPGEQLLYDVIGFQPSVLAMLRKRYSQEFGAFWDETPSQGVRLTTLQCNWLEGMLRELAANFTSRFLLERFLLNLAYEISRRPAEREGMAPLWLVQALHELSDIEVSRRGARVLAELTGRSFEHVSRVLKKSCGLTPSQVINRARVEYAASQLVLTEQEILHVALDCGFLSLGHFYKEFTAYYGCTPRHYRLQNRAAAKYPVAEGRA